MKLLPKYFIGTPDEVEQHMIKNKISKTTFLGIYPQGTKTIVWYLKFEKGD